MRALATQFSATPPVRHRLRETYFRRWRDDRGIVGAARDPSSQAREGARAIVLAQSDSTGGDRALPGELVHQRAQRRRLQRLAQQREAARAHLALHLGGVVGGDDDHGRLRPRGGAHGRHRLQRRCRSSR